MSNITKLAGGILGGVVAAAIAASVVGSFGVSEIRCGINGTNGSVLTVTLSIAAAGIAGLTRIARPIRAVFGGWFFLSLLGCTLLIVVWINALAPSCPFQSR
jgi:hypothetical protein